MLMMVCVMIMSHKILARAHLRPIVGPIPVSPASRQGAVGSSVASSPPRTQLAVETSDMPAKFTTDVDEVFQHLFVAGSRFGQASNGGLVATETGPLLLHQLVLSLFGLGELRRYDDQTQVDHKEGAYLCTDHNMSTMEILKAMVQKA